jgi:hypothetical protein
MLVSHLSRRSRLMFTGYSTAMHYEPPSTVSSSSKTDLVELSVGCLRGHLYHKVKALPSNHTSESLHKETACSSVNVPTVLARVHLVCFRGVGGPPGLSRAASAAYRVALLV